MNFGKLNKRITITTSTSDVKGNDGFISVVYTQKTRWAKVTPKNGMKQDESGKTRNFQDFEVITRYDTNIVTDIGKFVITYGSKTLTPHTITNVNEDDDYIVLMCSDGGN